MEFFEERVRSTVSPKRHEDINWELITEWIYSLQNLKEYVRTNALYLREDYNGIEDGYVKMMMYEMGTPFSSDSLIWIRRCIPSINNPHDPFKISPNDYSIPQPLTIDDIYTCRFTMMLSLNRQGIPFDVIRLISSYYRAYVTKGPIIRGEQWYYRPGGLADLDP